ncbi:uncharacterized protein LOC143195349 [Rhynchophorus ferrugineus]|uniref:uncharacterized protein LOC143195349 n=1 Tax=Rhynchophorus ferrugineus TaxID=354439 RepID=UPI003FCC5C65
MQFHALNYLLIALLLVVVGFSEAISSNYRSYLLNQVSDFNDIVEAEESPENIRQDQPSLPSEYFRAPSHRSSHERSSGSVPDDSVFSSMCLSDSLCPKHDIKHRASALELSPTIYQMETAETQVDNGFDGAPPQNLHVENKFGRNSDSEAAPRTVIIKENPQSVQDRSFEEKASNDQAYTNKDNNLSHLGCRNCKGLKDFFPIPLLESILISRLLESVRNDQGKSYPLKYIVRTVVPTFANVQNLENPSVAASFRNYLQKREKQFERLKRNAKRQKRRLRRKKKRRHRKHHHHHHHRHEGKPRFYRNATDAAREHLENELNNMVGYINQNQTFKDAYNYLPVIFGTVKPSPEQVLLAAIKHNASDEEKLMLTKILSLRPINESIVIHQNQNSSTTNSTGTNSNANVTLESSSVKPAGQENATLNLNLNLNAPDVKKTIMEIMKRQQKISNRETLEDERPERDLNSPNTSSAPPTLTSPTQPALAPPPPVPASVPSPILVTPPSPIPPEQSLPPPASTGQSVTEAPPPVAPLLNEVPGILIYPKTPSKKKKRFANVDLPLSGNTLSGQVDISQILKDINNANEKTDAILDEPKSKKECTKCAEETSKILDILHDLKEDSIKPDEGAFIEYGSSSEPTNEEAHVVPTQSQANKPVTTNNKPNIDTEAKLAKLRKDLQLVSEIQKIINGVAKVDRKSKKKREAKKAKAAVKAPQNEPEDNRFENEISGLIEIRKMLRKNKTKISAPPNSFLANR